MRRAALVFALLTGCTGLVSDPGSIDSGSMSSLDAGSDDAGPVEVDSGVVDAGDVDAGEVDAGEVDAGVVDAGVVDAGVDAGVFDAGTFALTFTPIPDTEPDVVAPGRGAEHWNNVPWDNVSAMTVPAGVQNARNVYYRFSWSDLQRATSTIDWTVFDREVNRAIDQGKIFSFGVMNLYTGAPWTMVGGAGLSYPLFVHDAMQAAAVNERDWIDPMTGAWIPNWNSAAYLQAWNDLMVAIAQHLATTSHAGHLYRDVIGTIDVRGYGDFGEWHTWPWYTTEPTGRAATQASLDALLDATKNAFPDQQLVVLIGALDPGNASRMPPEVSYRALTSSNARGRFGWRRDQWGDRGIDHVLAENSTVYQGTPLVDLIMNAWKVGPVVGEPNNDLSNISQVCGTPQCDLEREVRLYHASSFGNGNYPLVASDAALQANVRAASRATGYRLVLTGGQMTEQLRAGAAFDVSLSWQNVGLAPVYEPWTTTLSLVDGNGTVGWTATSAFQVKGFLPDASATVISERFTLPSSLGAGPWSLILTLVDPKGYRAPLPLALRETQPDGRVVLRPGIQVP